MNYRALTQLVSVAALLFGASACKDDDCSAGTAGCQCLAGDVCGPGLDCQDGTCEGGRVITLTVSDADARSCELLLDEGGAEVLAVDYGDEVTGSYIREAPLVALAFHGNADAAISSFRLVVSGENNPEHTKTACFDRAGRPLDDVRIDEN